MRGQWHPVTLGARRSSRRPSRDVSLAGIWLRPSVCLALSTSRATQTAANSEERRGKRDILPFAEHVRFNDDVMPTCIAS